MLGYLFSGWRQPDLVLGTAGRVIYGRSLPFEWRPRFERPPANPSLADLHRATEWLLTRNSDGLSVLLGIIMVLICVAVLVIKTIVRSKSHWNLLPLAVAWIILYLVGDIPFTTLSALFPNYTSVFDIDKWNTLLGLVLPLRTPRVISGPTTYALLLCAFWDTGVVLVTSKYTRYGVPKRESLGDWFLLIGTLLFTARFTDLAIMLPLVERSGGQIFVEKYESLSSFGFSAVGGALYFVGLPFFVSVTYDCLLCQGRTFSPLEPLPSVKEIKQEAVVENSEESLHTHGDNVYNFFWDQMCTAREQLQILQANGYGAAQNHLDLAEIYRTLTKAYCAMLPLRAAFNAMIQFKVAHGQDTTAMVVQQTAVENAIIRLKEQIFYLVSNFDDFKFELERSAPDMELYQRIQAFRRETEQFVLEQKDVEGELENLRDSIRGLEERMSSSVPIPSLAGSMEEVRRREQLAREEMDEAEKYVQQALKMLAEREAAESAEAAMQLQAEGNALNNVKLEEGEEQTENTGEIQDDKTDGSAEETVVEEDFRVSPEREDIEPNHRLRQEETPRAVLATSVEEIGFGDAPFSAAVTVAVEEPATGSAAIDAGFETNSSQGLASTYMSEFRNDQAPLAQPEQNTEDVVAVEQTTEAVAVEEHKIEQAMAVGEPVEIPESESRPHKYENEEPTTETQQVPIEETVVIVDIPSQQEEVVTNGYSAPKEEHVDECQLLQTEFIEVNDTATVQELVIESNDSPTTEPIIVNNTVLVTEDPKLQYALEANDDDSGFAGKSMENPIVISGGSSPDIVPRSVSIEAAATFDVSSVSPPAVTSSPRKNPSTMKDENAGQSKASTSGPKKSAGHMVVDLWTGVKSIEFKTDTFLRGDNDTELLTADDVLIFIELGKYFAARIRGNRAEMVAASKILNNLEKLGKAAKENKSTLNVGSNNHNYFRSCMWLGQARLAKFPVTSPVREFTEIPIEGIIKLAGYGPDGIHKMGMLPLPEETWREYLNRMSTTSEEKKIKELHSWLERYLGGLPSLLERKVPRAEGWDSGVSLDVNRCLFRHLENLMLLPPYSVEIEREVTIFKLEKDKTMQVDSGLVTDLVENLLSSPRSRNTGDDIEYQPL
ncbi:hypothetical protein FRC16_006897 [Serendipita sp. 398]|nr:hypothetical protein FRC16_006897 [Serendipita sp. 398]